MLSKSNTSAYRVFYNLPLFNERFLAMEKTTEKTSSAEISQYLCYLQHPKLLKVVFENIDAYSDKKIYSCYEQYNDLSKGLRKTSASSLIFRQRLKQYFQNTNTLTEADIWILQMSSIWTKFLIVLSEANK